MQVSDDCNRIINIQRGEHEHPLRQLRVASDRLCEHGRDPDPGGEAMPTPPGRKVDAIVNHGKFHLPDLGGSGQVPGVPLL